MLCILSHICYCINMHIINTNMYVAIVVDFVSIYTKLYYLCDFKVVQYFKYVLRSEIIRLNIIFHN